MKQYNTVFGLDSHARSTTICAITQSTGEVKSKTFRDCPGACEMASWMLTFPGPHFAAYESGCTGFEPWRQLSEFGIECGVVAVSSIPRSTDGKNKKNDKHDARQLALELVKVVSDLSYVWVPDEETEGAREVARAYHTAAVASKRAKQQLSSFLLRHGHVWNERTQSGRLKKTSSLDYKRWLDKISFDDKATADAFEYLRATISETNARQAQGARLVDCYSKMPRWKPYVDAISAIKGNGPISAFIYTVEIGDFTRFPSGRKLPCWAGITPKNNSSGESVRFGKITKAGNSLVRCTLLEGAGGLATSKSYISKKPGKDAVISQEVLEQVKLGSKRLGLKVKALKQTGKHSNVIKVALANEMIKWVWAIGVMVAHEQEALTARHSGS